MTEELTPMDALEGDFIDAWEAHAADFEMIALQMVRSRAHNCESAIERKMLPHLYMVRLRFDWLMATVLDKPEAVVTRLYQQFREGPYRLDFAMTMAVAAPHVDVKLAIECDGHDYHERTKEQARRDRERDRYLTERGYLVVRFTGSEIWADAVGCAHKVGQILEAAANRQLKVTNAIEAARDSGANA